MLTYYAGSVTGKIEQLFLGLGAVGGKSSKDVAKGIKERLELMGRHGKQPGGSTVDSGAGTPESLTAACRDKNFYDKCALTSSCGLHDVMSVFRLPIKNCIGFGSLDLDNAPQLMHTLYAFHYLFKELWERLVIAVGEQLNMEVSKELKQTQQCPLITRW